jgi:hypothetical protein
MISGDIEDNSCSKIFNARLSQWCMFLQIPEIKIRQKWDIETTACIHNDN